MGEWESLFAHRYQTLLRLYVATAPEEAELSWQRQQRFEQLAAQAKELGHWYRFEGSQDLIEVTAEGSGQWYPEGEIPADVDPHMVIDVPAGAPTPTLLDGITGVLREVPMTAPNYAEVAELIATVEDVGSPERAAGLAKSFQRTLASVPAKAEEQLRFLQQASQQIVGTELLAGRTTGYDAAGVLLVEAIAGAVAADDPAMCSTILAKAATWQVSSVAEMGAKLIDECWYRRLGDKVVAALDSLRQRGEQVVEQAREGSYPEGHPEMALDIYYGGILQALPYLLATNSGYVKLSHAPVEDEERQRFLKKADTSEEKLIRLRTALLYAVGDMDLSQLRDKQARVAAVLRGGDRDRAEALVHEIIDLEFFYPPPFRSVLMVGKA